jgi:hypothetical protein
MRAEADHLAADGIVGVNLRTQMYAWGQSCLEFGATGTAVRRLADEHKLPDTTPKPTFTLGLDSRPSWRDAIHLMVRQSMTGTPFHGNIVVDPGYVVDLVHFRPPNQP